MDSLEKKLKQNAWHHDCITEVVELETAQKELGKVAHKIRELCYPVNMGEWIRENSDAKNIGELLERYIKQKILVLLVEQREK